MKHREDGQRESSAAEQKKLKGKDYEGELERLHVELVKLQEWVRHKGLKACIVFEGRDGAGKGGRSRPLPNASARECFGSWPCPHPLNVSNPRCTSSAICRFCQRPVRS